MSNVPETLKNMSKNRSLILGGQVITWWCGKEIHSMMVFGRFGDQQKTFVQDTCQGDSGGPLWTDVDGKAFLIGINLFLSKKILIYKEV